MCLPLICTCVDRTEALNSRQKPSTVLTWNVTVRLLPRLVALDVFDGLRIIEIGLKEVVPDVG
jgi:hypothetical protein